MYVTIRGFKNRERVFEDTIEVDSEHGLFDLVRTLAISHAQQLADGPHMIEMEFLDETDPNQRFFRFGTDPTGMVMPIEIPLPPEEN
jgi:hypothetical protein